ncbi:MAG: hypothetical protein BWX84_02255 [Verrucomicrobia bacterium ADurb.Bin118]|nr:MAG: hypothetical protein BWX84_02255 [Verrucomicrobia bacterium ADurb.Bin118]
MKDGADLRGDDNGAVEIPGLIFKVFVEALPANRPRFLRAFVHVESFFHLAAAFGGLGADAINFVADVDTIGHGALVIVFHHEILVKEADGLLGGRGGEADEEAVEVFEHLPPEIVDRAVTFIGDDEVERFDGNLRVVFYFARPVIGDGKFKAGFLVNILVQFLAAQDRIKTLDGANRHAGHGIQLVGSEVLDVIQLGELAPGIRRDELLKLGERLPAKVGAVHEKQNALCARMLDQPVRERASRVSLAGAGGHLDQRARVALGERFLQIRDGFDLTGPHAGRIEWVPLRHDGEFGAESA